MSSLTLITGTIFDCEDLLGRLDLRELYYESLYEYPEDQSMKSVFHEPIPMKIAGSKFSIIQPTGAGKTLYAVHILAMKAYVGGRVTGNLALAWDNQEISDKSLWVSGIQCIDDLDKLSSITILIDDIKSTISGWNCKEADLIGKIANAGRKNKLDIIITAQRENFIPPAIRDMATAWIVPVIRVRDFTIDTPDDNGFPLELIGLHFDGAKTFQFISKPLVCLDRLFAAYSTMQKAISLKAGSEGSRSNQAGFALEVEALEFLKSSYPGEVWQHLSGKNVFDIVSKRFAVDVAGLDDVDGRLHTKHKNLNAHIRTAQRKKLKPLMMFKDAMGWGFLVINYDFSSQFQDKNVNMCDISKRIRRTL